MIEEVKNYKKGDYVTITYDTRNNYTLKISEDIQNCLECDFRLGIDCRTFATKGGFYCSTFTKIRYATQEEIQWLNVCIQQNRFISLERAKSLFEPIETTYEIY